MTKMLIDLRTAAQQALEVMEKGMVCKARWVSDCANAIIDLRAALAEPEQEPYDQTALELCNVCGWKTLIPGDCCLNCERKHPLGQASTDVPLTVYSVKKAEPVQERKPEPVAWRWRMRNLTDAPGFVQPWTVTTYYPREQANEIEPLYTAPPQRKPLTEEEIRDLWSWAMTAEAERTATTQQHAFARAIERAHGIT